MSRVVNIAVLVSLSILSVILLEYWHDYCWYFSSVILKWVSVILFLLFFGNIRFRYFCEQATPLWLLYNNTWAKPNWNRLTSASVIETVTALVLTLCLSRPWATMWCRWLAMRTVWWRWQSSARFRKFATTSRESLTLCSASLSAITRWTTRSSASTAYDHCWTTSRWLGNVTDVRMLDLCSQGCGFKSQLGHCGRLTVSEQVDHLGIYIGNQHQGQLSLSSLRIRQIEYLPRG